MTAPAKPFRPTREQLAAAVARTVPDVIAPGLKVLLVGINPGLYSAAIGHHFGRPGNRFWPALHAGGFTPRVLSPFEESTLPQYGLGLVNLVDRTTATAAELSPDELREGRNRLERKVRKYRPRYVAFLGITSYRSAFERPKAQLGPLPEDVAGARAWLLPNPSGLNAHHQAKDLALLFGALREAAERD